MVASVTDANFDAEVMHADQPVLIDFWAPWCGPCKAMSPVVTEIADEFGDEVKVIKVNIDDAPKAATQFGVSSIPNLTIVKDGQVKAQLTGARPKQALVNALQPHLNSRV